MHVYTYEMSVALSRVQMFVTVDFRIFIPWGDQESLKKNKVDIYRRTPHCGYKKLGIRVKFWCISSAVNQRVIKAKGGLDVPENTGLLEM